MAVWVVHRLNMKGSAHAFSPGQVKRFVANAQSGSAGRIGAVTIAHQHDMLIHDRLNDRAQGIGIDRRKHCADGHTAAVSGKQHRHLLI